jgi:chaperonin GroES
MSTSAKIIPLEDRILLEPLGKEDKKSKGGIIIPETVDKERPEQGKVIAVGPGKISDDGKRVPLQVKKGQIVLFSKYSPNEIKVGDKEYYIIRESDIFAIIEN